MMLGLHARHIRTALREGDALAYTYFVSGKQTHTDGTNKPRDCRGGDRKQGRKVCVRFCVWSIVQNVRSATVA